MAGKGQHTEGLRADWRLTDLLRKAEQWLPDVLRPNVPHSFRSLHNDDTLSRRLAPEVCLNCIDKRVDGVVGK